MMNTESLSECNDDLISQSDWTGCFSKRGVTVGFCALMC